MLFLLLLLHHHPTRTLQCRQTTIITQHITFFIPLLSLIQISLWRVRDSNESQIRNSNENHKKDIQTDDQMPVIIALTSKIKQLQQTTVVGREIDPFIFILHFQFHMFSRSRSRSESESESESDGFEFGGFKCMNP